MVSGMIYEPYEQGIIMRLEHHLVGGYVRYISPHIIIIIKKTTHVSGDGACALTKGYHVTCNVATGSADHCPVRLMADKIY